MGLWFSPVSSQPVGGGLRQDCGQFSGFFEFVINCPYAKAGSFIVVLPMTGVFCAMAGGETNIGSADRSGAADQYFMAM